MINSKYVDFHAAAGNPYILELESDIALSLQGKKYAGLGVIQDGTHVGQIVRTKPGSDCLQYISYDDAGLKKLDVERPFEIWTESDRHQKVDFKNR